MGSLSFPAHFTVSRIPFSPLSARFFSVGCLVSPPMSKGVKWGKKRCILVEFSGCRRGVSRMCKRGEGEGDQALLEVELLEFMKNSKNPDMFPSKSELIQCGRLDLAEAIEKGGGWMSMGWDNDDNDNDDDDTGGSHKVEIEDGVARNWEFDLGQNGYEVADSSSGSELEDQDPEGISWMGNSSPDDTASSSGQSIEMTTTDDRGIEGILNRLERHRSLNFGLNVEKNENSRQLGGRMSDRMNRYSSKSKGRTANTSAGELMVVTTDIKELLDKTEDLNYSVNEINLSDVKTRLQHLEVELSSVLRSFKSNTTSLSEKTKEYMSEDLRQLSDATELQENETIYAQEKLRSIRSKLAILEGKKALALNDAQKILDEKQTRIDIASRALELLRSACIVWANSGSEVLVVGSFDGWATQRKMEKSNSGVFTLSLKLYPGQYEIKFIVDGSWKIDPLRPIVNNCGFENNLLIVT